MQIFKSSFDLFWKGFIPKKSLIGTMVALQATHFMRLKHSSISPRLVIIERSASPFEVKFECGQQGAIESAFNTGRGSMNFPTRPASRYSSTDFIITSMNRASPRSSKHSLVLIISSSNENFLTPSPDSFSRQTPNNISRLKFIIELFPL